VYPKGGYGGFVLVALLLGGLGAGGYFYGPKAWAWYQEREAADREAQAAEHSRWHCFEVRTRGGDKKWSLCHESMAACVASHEEMLASEEDYGVDRCAAPDEIYLLNCAADDQSKSCNKAFPSKPECKKAIDDMTEGTGARCTVDPNIAR
jgi:hypothetical protein